MANTGKTSPRAASPSHEDLEAAQAAAAFADRAFEDSEEEDEEEVEEEESGPRGGDGEGWFLKKLGPEGMGSPHPSRLRDDLAGTPMHACSVAGADKWQVERLNPDTGDTESLGTCYLKITLTSFIKQFFDSMPEEGDDAATFYLTPLDKAGRRLGSPGEPYGVQIIPWDNITLQKLRDAMPRRSRRGRGAGEPGNEMLALMREQMNALAERLAAAEKAAAEERRRADDQREKALLERANYQNSMHSDLSVAYAGLSKVQQESMAGVAKTASELAAEQARAERDARAADRERLRAEAEADRARLKAEAEAAAERERIRANAEIEKVKAEAMVRAEEAKAQIALRQAEIQAQVEQARIHAENERLRWERERENERQRAKEEAEARRALAIEDATRAREHALSMEKIRTESADRAERYAKEHRESQDKYFTLMVQTLQTQHSDKGKLGVIGDVLETLGLTPAEALAQAKEMFGGGGGGGKGIGVAIIEAISGVTRDLIKAGAGAGAVSEDEEDETDETDEAETEEAAPEEPQPEPEPEPKPKLKRLTVKGPDLNAFANAKVPAEPDAVVTSEPMPDAPPPVAVQALLAPPPPPVNLAEQKAARDAVAAFVEKITDQPPEKWGGILMECDVQVLVAQINKAGLAATFEGHDVALDKLTQVLLDMGLFAGSVPQ